MQYPLIYGNSDMLKSLYRRKKWNTRWDNDLIDKSLLSRGSNSIQYKYIVFLTLYGPNSFFRRFSGHNLR